MLLIARRRIVSWPNVAIITGDAVDNLPEDGTIFYAFNPFNAAVMARLKARMEALFRDKREVVLLYYNCHHAGVFQSDPAWRIEILGEIGPLPAALITLTKDPAREETAPDPNRMDSTRTAVTS